MTMISIRELESSDESAFVHACLCSQSLHAAWTDTPKTAEAFKEYFTRFQQPNNKSFVVVTEENELIGVFNISEIVRGKFQNAYLGYYAFAALAGKGYMSQGLKLVLDKVFNEMDLHRIEANIQPENVSSIYLVQKNKFRKEGYSPRYLKINGKWQDHERWAITIEDWQQEDCE